MRLSDEQIAKYQQIYLDSFGEAVSMEDALVQGMALLRLVKALSSPTNDNVEENDYGKRPITQNYS
jgi:hypothetical protein